MDLYHVTFTVSSPSIYRRGLLRGMPSNWLKAGDRSRYGAGEVYAFEHPADAVRWAGKMDWHFHTGTGTGKVMIVHFRSDAPGWEEDLSDPLAHAGSKGRWLKLRDRVPREAIVSATPVTIETLRRLVAHDRAETTADMTLAP